VSILRIARLRSDTFRYLILDVLGQGTFGQVVKCQNMRTHDICAVKVVKNKPAYLNQSKMEVAILDLVSLHDSGQGSLLISHSSTSSTTQATPTTSSAWSSPSPTKATSASSSNASRPTCTSSSSKTNSRVSAHSWSRFSLSSSLNV